MSRSIHFLPLIGLSVWVLGVSGRPAFSSEDVLRKSVVKIFTTYVKPYYYQPWDTGNQSNLNGSGCIIEGQRILTNAHVVSDQVYVQVLKAGDTKKYSAIVEFVAHDSEIAVLKVEDADFFKETVPVKWGEMPFQRDKVAVYGFPAGGEDLSITEGVVSRIEVREYTHSQRQLLTIQTDAAINPGNSGGPVFGEGKLVGIAFQSYSGNKNVENIGYVVPIAMIRRFLSDIKDNHYDGVPDLGVAWQKLENKDLRDYYKMPSDQVGVLVTGVTHEGSSWQFLKEGDVILEIDGQRVATDGTIQFRESERLNFSHIVSQRQIGEKVSVRVKRDGQLLELSIALRSYRRLVPGPLYDVGPRYFIYAGFVFMPVTVNYIRIWDWKDASSNLKSSYLFDPLTPEKKEIILLHQVLAHDINVGYHKHGELFIKKINNRPIVELRDVVEAFKSPSGSHHVIEIGQFFNFPNDQPSRDSTSKIVINANKAVEANKEILSRYKIPSDRSIDLQ